MSFHDHFSGHAGAYAKYRPDYPPALFDYLATVAPARALAWDVGTGSGQAALGLVPFFQHIVASDPSAEQIEQAQPHPQVTYVVAAAEQSSLPAHSVDLITVAQAIHWFDFARFYAEVRRVLKPDGRLAVFGYGLNEITPAIDAIMLRYYRDIVGPYWPPERRYLDEQYATLPFPFTELRTPSFRLQQSWDLAAFRGYLATWSATQGYLRERGSDPLALIDAALINAWGTPTIARRVTWPLYLRVGR
ncbi:MAG: class I SAM-dependent methyltransferase [Gammaproteobacteria bacterium]|nr:class I SAM-dependent methyltransferase [Gammaproteobacteria bacterium]